MLSIVAGSRSTSFEFPYLIHHSPVSRTRAFVAMKLAPRIIFERPGKAIEFVGTTRKRCWNNEVPTCNIIVASPRMGMGIWLTPDRFTIESVSSVQIGSIDWSIIEGIAPVSHRANV